MQICLSPSFIRVEHLAYLPFFLGLYSSSIFEAPSAPSTALFTPFLPPQMLLLFRILCLSLIPGLSLGQSDLEPS